MEGWIKLHRQISDNPFWTCEKFTRGQAWVDLLILANHKDNFFFKRGVKVVVERGQVGWSSIALSERWKWSRSKVKKFLNDLEKEQQIQQHQNNVTQIITIVNYEKFQSKEQQTEQQKDSKKTAEEQQKDTNKNDNNDNNDNNEKEKKIVKPKGFDFSFINNFNLNGSSEKFKEVLIEWLDYKKEIKNSYKSQNSVETFFKQLLKLSGNNTQIAKDIINNSIANNYKGIFEIKNNTNGKTARIQHDQDDFSNGSGW